MPTDNDVRKRRIINLTILIYMFAFKKIQLAPSSNVSSCLNFRSDDLSHNDKS